MTGVGAKALIPVSRGTSLFRQYRFDNNRCQMYHNGGIDRVNTIKSICLVGHGLRCSLPSDRCGLRGIN